MIRPGYFTLPRHDPSLVRDLIRDTKPSCIKYWVSATSAEQVKEWQRLSPDTIFIMVDGEVGDSNDKYNLTELDEKSLAGKHAEMYARWRDKGFIGAAMTFNEPPIWKGKEYRAKLNSYTAEFLNAAHALGLNCCIFNFSVGWPKTWLDEDDWWPEFKSSVNGMKTGDYIGLHEYWSKDGPLALWPWLAGRHRLCPYNKPILISECGLDQATIEGGANKGWRYYLSPEAYVDQLVQYHRELDGRVKGTAIFLLDYENNVWESFDIRYCVDQLRRAQWTGESVFKPKPFSIDFIPGLLNVQQTGPNNYTVRTYTGSKVLAPDRCKVYGASGDTVRLNLFYRAIILTGVRPAVPEQTELGGGETVGFATSSSIGIFVRDFGITAETPSTGPTLEDTISAELQKHVLPLNPDAYFEKLARKQGLLPASREVDISFGGEVYRAQVYRKPDDRDYQYIIYAPVGQWEKAKWFKRRN